MSLAILRLPNGLDFSDLTTEIVTRTVPMPNVLGSSNNAISTISSDGMRTPRNLMHVDSNLNLDSLGGSANQLSATPQMGEFFGKWSISVWDW